MFLPKRVNSRPSPSTRERLIAQWLLQHFTPSLKRRKYCAPLLLLLTPHKTFLYLSPSTGFSWMRSNGLFVVYAGDKEQTCHRGKAWILIRDIHNRTCTHTNQDTELRTFRYVKSHLHKEGGLKTDLEPQQGVILFAPISDSVHCKPILLSTTNSFFFRPFHPFTFTSRRNLPISASLDFL